MTARSLTRTRAREATAAGNSKFKARARADTKREQILVAATHVFLMHGYEGTSMDRVAQASGAARRTLYNLFESKEALFEAMTERIWTEFPVIDITHDEVSLRDPCAGLTRLGHAVADFWIPPEAVAFLRMVIADGPRFPALTKTFLGKGKVPAMAAVAAYLDRLSRRRLVKIPDTTLAARQFLGLIDEPLLWGRVVGIDESFSAKHRKQVVSDAVEMFLRYYGVPRPNRFSGH